MADPSFRDPAEGSRDVVERQLAREAAATSIKNPQHEAENPGGQPTEAVKGSAPPPLRDPEGRQGTTMPGGH